MRTTAYFFGYTQLESAAAALGRCCVLLQEQAETDDFGRRLRQLRGIAAAAHRQWRVDNAELARPLVTPIDREDLSMLIRQLSDACEGCVQLAVVTRTLPRTVKTAWSARLSQGAIALRHLCAALPHAETVEDAAESLTLWRRETDAAFDKEALGTRGEPPGAPFYRACVQLAHIGNAVEWVSLKNR